MTTWALTGRESLLSILGKKLQRSQVRVKAVLLVVVRMLLVIAGLGFISAAAWFVAVPLGLLTIGLSLLVVEWAVKR